jgi:hypothetical protein
VAALLVNSLSAQTSLSIYSDGRVVVRQTLPRALEKGRNAFTLELEGVDPAAIFSPDTAVTLVSAVARPSSDRRQALERARGQTLSFVRAKGDTVRAQVVSVSPPQYRLANGQYLLVEPGDPLFPAELIRTVPELALVMDAARARSSTEVAYMTEGIRWSATYQVLLQGGGQAAVSGTASIASSSIRADSAAVQLVAGAIARPVAKQPVFAPMGRAAMAVAEQGAAAEEGVGETHVYTLPGRVTLERGVTVANALFPRSRAPFTQELVVPGVVPFLGDLVNNPTESNRVPVQVWYTIKRARGTPLGDRPLPGGTVQIYQADSAGRVQLLGETTSDHTAAGRDLRVQSGNAFDVTAERVQTDFSEEPIPPARRGLPARRRTTASYRVTITNARSEPVSVDVRESHYGNWAVVASSVPAEKLSSTEMRFRIPVPASGEATLTYTIRVES